MLTLGYSKTYQRELNMPKKHPNKEIQEAIGYAVNSGWRWIKTSGSSHPFCRLKCGEGVQ